MNIQQIRSFLSNHLEEKRENDSWLQKVLSSKDHPEKKFPYQPNEGGVGEMANKEVKVVPPSCAFSPSPAHGDSPVYLVEIPFYLPQDPTKATALFKKKVEMLRDQAFGGDPSQINDKALFVLGVNRRKPLSPTKRMEFFQTIQKLPEIKGIHYKVIGSFWKGSWKKTNPSPFLYSSRKAFLLVKAMDPSIGQKVEANLETSKTWKKQVPYRRLREWLKTHQFTKQAIQQVLPTKRPFYYVMMDSDFRSLKGIFSRCDEVLAKWKRQNRKKDADLFSPGYFASPKEKDVLRYGLKLDMDLREAISRDLPLGIYYPEPFRLSRIHSQQLFDQCSFLGKKMTDQTMEGQWFTKSAVKIGAIKENRSFFRSIPILQTTTERMRTKKNKRISIKMKSDLGKKEVLKSFRHVSQSLLSPKRWADHILRAYPKTVSESGKARGHLASIFHCFDPIHHAMKIPFGKSFKKDILSEVLKKYSTFSSQMLRALDCPVEKKRLLKEIFTFFPSSKKNKKQTETYFNELIKKAKRAIKELEKLGIERKWIQKVCRTAQRSGKAIGKTFKHIQKNLCSNS